MFLSSIRSVTRCQTYSFTRTVCAQLFKRRHSTSNESHESTRSTIDPDEVKKFGEMAKEWWDENGPHQSLHAMNDIRVPLVRDTVIGQLGADALTRPASKPLTGSTILDAGCGGGFLCEPLARLGATVTGIDPAEASIQVAREHAEQERLHDITYIHGTVEELVLTHEGQFDVVVSSEVVEHVSDVSSFVESCCKLAKSNGSVIFSTINRTKASYWIAIVAAENILGAVQKGTHSWDKFVTPDELIHELSKNGCTPQLIHGSMYNPITKRWKWTDSSDVNYAITAVKS